MPIITQSDDKLKEHTLKNVTVSVRPQRLQGSFALILFVPLGWNLNFWLCGRIRPKDISLFSCFDVMHRECSVVLRNILFMVLGEFTQHFASL